jgi:uncharacterized membrane protein (UPF0127 family)
MNYSDNTEDINFHLVKIGDKTFVLEECKDHNKGLSNREHLHENEGMLFNFMDKSSKSFHMRGCLFPLDIIFMKDNIIKKIHHECEPCQDGDCKKFECESADTVIELLGGTCKKHNINEGVLYQFF